MFRRALIVAAPLALMAAQAHASGKKAEAEGKAPVGQYVDLQPVGLPIVSKGRLVNYVFVYVRINLTSAANAARWREKEPFFRDALVRAAHRTPFTKDGDLSRIDEAKLSAAMMRDAAPIAGRGAVKSVVVTSQTPKKYIPAPHPAARP